MIFDELVLENFGPYRGRRVVSLAPREDRPIVLIGGLNGVGKTSLLDALQLVLYGKTAQCSKRFGVGYEEFLRRSAHRRASPEEESAVELSFQRVEDGRLRQYRLRRSWLRSTNSVRERMDVTVDGAPDRVLAETWDSYVEQLIPRRVSPLFFFDGEKVEGLADPQRSSEMLATAVHSLLGIDLIDRLRTDLLVLERRKRGEVRGDDERRRIQEAKANFVAVRERHEELVARRAHTQNQVDRRHKLLRDVERRFRAEGGDLFEQRAELETERVLAHERLVCARESVAESYAGDAPLLLVRNLIEEVVRQDARERDAERASLLEAVLQRRDRDLMLLLEAAPDGILDSVRAFIERDRLARAEALGCDVYLRLDAEQRTAFDRISERVRLRLPRDTATTMEELRDAQAALDEAERKLAAVPALETVAPLLEEKQQAEVEAQQAEACLAVVDEELRQVAVELEAKRTRLRTLLERGVESEFQHENAARLLKHSRMARETLDAFRERVIALQIGAIADAASESLRALMRKQHFLERLEIDGNTFAVRIHREDGVELSADLLSAGERQILAVALLWGLARVSERQLPIVIDTPLGRLDSVHRAHLVQMYFPRASHQVVLLSTDEEIADEHYESLRPFVGAEYHLWYNESEDSTEIRPGYRMEEAGVTC